MATFSAFGFTFHNPNAVALSGVGSTVCATSVRYRLTRYGSNWGAFELAPGASQTGNDLYDGTYQVYWTTTGGGEVAGDSVYLSGPSAVFELTIPASICAPPANPATNVCYVTLCAKNNDVVYHVYSLYKDGMEQNFNPNPGGLGIGAGKVGCYYFTVWCTNSTGWSLDYSSGEQGVQSLGPVTNALIKTNITWAQPATTNSVSQRDPSVYTPGESNIIWSASAQTNNTQATREGTEAIKSAIDTGNLNLANALSNIAGRVSGTTNGTGNGDLTNAIDRFRQQNTNLLTQILTNLSNGRTGVITGTMTNQGVATTAGEAAISDVTTAGNDIRGLIGDAPTLGGGDGDPAVFSMQFAGKTIDMNPNTIMPGVMGVAKTLLTAIVLILFGMEVGRMFYDMVKTFASAQTGGIPDMNVLGNNPLGLAAAPLVSLAMIAVWVVALVTVTAVLVSALSGFAAAMTAAAGLSLPAGTSYLLAQTTPVTLIVSLAFTRIVIFITAAKAVAIAAAISRFLVGK